MKTGGGGVGAWRAPRMGAQMIEDFGAPCPAMPSPSATCSRRCSRHRGRETPRRSLCRLLGCHDMPVRASHDPVQGMVADPIIMAMAVEPSSAQILSGKNTPGRVQRWAWPRP